jgi:hypothetical protein
MAMALDPLDLPTSLLVNGCSGLLLGVSLALAADVIEWWHNKWWQLIAVWVAWAAVIVTASMPDLDWLHGRRIANSMVALWVVYLLLRKVRGHDASESQATDRSA